MNERALFEAYQARPTQDGLLALLRASQHTVYNLCIQVLRHSQDAEDASQKVFLRILDALPRIADGEHYRRLLCRASYQVAFNMLESRKTRRAHEMKKAEGAPPAVTTSPEENSALLHQHIAGLDDHLRCLLVDHYFEGKPMEVMASERGCSRVAVWKGIEKAKERLRLSLSGAGLVGVALAMPSTLEAAVFRGAPRNLIGDAVATKVAGIIASGSTGAAGGPLAGLPGTPPGGWVLAGAQGKAGIVMASLAGAALLAGALLAAHRGTSRISEVSRRSPPPAVALAETFRPPAAGDASAGPRRPTLEDSGPNPPRIPRPYPFSLPRPDWNPAVRAAWDGLNTRVTLDCENVPEGQLLQLITKQSGLVIRVDPELQGRDELITYVVQDILTEGALRLLLQPRNQGFAIQEDGTLFVSTPEKAVSAYSQDILDVKQAVQGLYEAQSRAERSDGRSDGERTIELLDSRRVSPPQGEWTVRETLQALSQSADLPIRLDSADGARRVVEELTAQKCLNVVDEKPLSELLAGLLSARGLDFAVDEGGRITVSTPEGAQAIRKEQAHQAELRRIWELQLELPAGISGEHSVADLPEAVEKGVGLPVVASREVWESAATARLPDGASAKEWLDHFKASGLRWAIQQGRLYLWSKP